MGTETGTAPRASGRPEGGFRSSWAMPGRGWRRFALLPIFVVLALILWATLWRRSQLNGLPDVGEPSPPAMVSVPDDRNAFVPYRQAAARFRDMSEDEGTSFSKANLSWPDADATLRRWVADNDEAIRLLCQGSERDRVDLRGPTNPTDLIAHSESVEFARRMSWIGTAALFKAGQFQAKGDLSGAWTILRAAVRASQHMGWAVPRVQDRTHVIILIQYAREPVTRWANDKSVSVSQLRQALDDLVAAEALAPPLALTYYEEYRATEASLIDLRPFLDADARNRPADAPFDPLASTPRLKAYLRSEPERSRRVLRLLAANDLAWCDRPFSERPELAVPRLQIFEPAPTAPSASRALPPDDLARWTDSSLIAPAIGWRVSTNGIAMIASVERWSMGRLKEAVAVSLFSRENGRRPVSPAEALQRYFPITDDPVVPDKE